MACDLYRRGHYTEGSGKASTTCYIMPKCNSIFSYDHNQNHYNNPHLIVQHIAFEYIICFVAFDYVGLEKNELCNEQNIIDKENECTLAAISIGKYNNGITKTESSSAYPRGCYVHVTSDVWFNSHPSGNGNENAAPICRIGKFICL